MSRNKPLDIKSTNFLCLSIALGYVLDCATSQEVIIEGHSSRAFLFI